MNQFCTHAYKTKSKKLEGAERVSLPLQKTSPIYKKEQMLNGALYSQKIVPKIEIQNFPQ